MISMHRFYIDINDIEGNIATMTGQEAKHLANVLRLGPGARVELADGNGTHYLSEIEKASSKKVTFKIIDRIFLQAESPAHITVAQGMLKDKKMDVTLRHLTELGIKEWIPFFASRSVPSPDNSVRKMADLIIDKNSSHTRTTDVRVERWERIAKESIKQCGRSCLPLIHKPLLFGEMLSMVSSYSEKITFWEKATTSVDEIREKQVSRERGGLKEVGSSCHTCSGKSGNGELHPDQKQINQNQGKIVVMIGPEGGFSEEEINIAKDNGFQTFSLGSRILRAETASIAACTLIQNIFGDLGKKMAENT